MPCIYDFGGLRTNGRLITREVEGGPERENVDLYGHCAVDAEEIGYRAGYLEVARHLFVLSRPSSHTVPAANYNDMTYDLALFVG